MKNLSKLFFLIIFCSNTTFAQDTMYVYQGTTVTSFLVSSIDSIIFYQYIPPVPTTVTDVNGNVYTTEVFGNQEWMTQNLKVSAYNDNTPIPYFDIFTNDVENYSWFDNDSATYFNPYGGYYSSIVALSGNTCPTGWHLPSQSEWDELITFLGGPTVAGGKLKESGTTHWTAPNTGSENSVGFNAVGGSNMSAGLPGAGAMNDKALYWTSTINGSYVKVLRLTYNSSETSYYDYYNTSSQNVGYNIRCVKD